MAKDYTVLLKAKIDPAGLDFSAIDKKIADINKKAYKIMVAVDTVGLKDVEKRLQELASQIKNKSEPLRIIDAQHEIGMLNQIERKIEEIKSKKGSISGYSIQTTAGEGGEQNLTSATVKYTNAQKQAVAETYKWVNVAQAGEKADMAWVRTKESLTDNIKANEDAMNRAKQKASEYLEKIKSLNQQNANVIKGKGIAEQLLGETDPAKIQQLSKELDVIKQSSQGARAGILSFTEGMKSSIMRTVEYSLSLGLLYGALNQVRNGIKYITELNKEMTNIQLVTGGTNEEINSMAMGYNSLAKEMGATTLEVAKGSLEFVRQGKSAEETAILIKNSTMMSKLGNMEAAEATDKLTSIMNGFQLTAGETGVVVDKLVGLDNKFATSVDEIATAMKYGSNSARQAGIDFNHLAAYVTVVSSTTRQSAETIGQSFKTMTSRFTDIKQGFDIGEGVDVNINNVEKSLRAVNIPIRDSANNFRDMQDVISDLGKVWKGLTEVQQANITKQFAGIRQKEQFLVLMNEQVKVEQALRVEQESTNLAEERYAIYLKSVEAAQNRVTASWEKLVMSAATGEMVAGFLNALTAVLEFLDGIGGIPTVLKIIIPLIILFNAALIKTNIEMAIMTASGFIKFLLGVVPALFGATTAREGLTLALGAANVAALPLVITLGAVALAIYGVIKANEEFAESERKKVDAILEARNKLQPKNYKEYVEGAKKDNQGVQFEEETGKAFRAAGSGSKKYLPELDILTEDMWEATQMQDRFIEGNEGMNNTIKQTAREIEGIGNQEFIAKMEEIERSFQSLDEALLNIGQGEALDEQTLKLSNLGIEWEYLNGKVVVNQKSIEDWQQAQIDALSEGAILTKEQGDAISRLTDTFTNSIDGIELTRTQYQYLANDISGSLFDAAEKANFALTDINGNALTTADSVKTAMLSNFANFTKLVGDMKTQGLMNYNEFLSYLMKGASFSGGLTPYKPTAAKVFPSATTKPKSTATGDSNEVKKLNKEIERLENKKDALKDLTDEFKDYIDLQKESLKLQKEEKEFSDELLEKNKTLAQMKTDIIMLSLDDSEEAKAKRLQLEEDAASLEKEITQDTEDRKYDLQIDALDRLQKEYEKNINDQMSMIDERISKVKEDVSEVKKAESAVGDVSNATRDLGVITAQIGQEIVDWYSKQANLSETNKMKLQEQVNLWVKQGLTIDQVSQKASNYAQQLANVISWQLALNSLGETGSPAIQTSLSQRGRGTNSKYHDGGIVESHHNGEFAGNLKSNEVFSKLMKGEYVATESQMNGFLQKTLPSLLGTPSISRMGGGGDISVSMPINVAGNLDKQILPDLEKIVNKVVDKINDSMKSRGFVRSTSLTSI